MRATVRLGVTRWTADVTRFHVAVVCADETLRLEAAKAFDDAPVDWKITLHDTAPSSADVIVSADAAGGDVRFDPLCPQDVLERVAQASAARTAVIAIVGSSGGCGVSSVALHLAAGIEGRICYVDATSDLGAAIRLGLGAEEVSAATGGIDPIPVVGGFGYLPAGDTPVPDLLADLTGRFDAVVVDLPAERLGQIAERLTTAVLVLAPTVPAARRAAAILDRHEELAWAVVSNRVGPGGESTDAELAQILGRRIGLRLPCSPALRDAEDDDRLLTSAWSPWRRRVERLARAVS